MRIGPLHRRRRGTTAVEFALVAPLVLALTIGLLVGGLGVFRYQQVAALAREGARWASVHGFQYFKETGNPAATPQDVYQNAIAPRMVILDPAYLSCTVTWDTDNHPFHTLIDGNGNLVKKTNTVTVTVNYQWTPESFFSPITLTSTSVVPMEF